MKEGFVLLIKNKVDFFGGYILIVLIVWNINVKLNRVFKWFKVFVFEFIGEV